MRRRSTLTTARRISNSTSTTRSSSGRRSTPVDTSRRSRDSHDRIAISPDRTDGVFSGVSLANHRGRPNAGCNVRRGVVEGRLSIGPKTVGNRTHDAIDRDDSAAGLARCFVTRLDSALWRCSYPLESVHLIIVGRHGDGFAANGRRSAVPAATRMASIGVGCIRCRSHRPSEFGRYNWILETVHRRLGAYERAVLGGYVPGQRPRPTSDSWSSSSACHVRGRTATIRARR